MIKLAILVIFIFISIKATSTENPKTIIRSKDLMKDEIDNEQLVLIFPITWDYYNQMREQIKLNNNQTKRRVRRGVWGACLGGVVGGLAGYYESSHSGWKALPNTLFRAGEGAILGGTYLPFRRKRSTTNRYLIDLKRNPGILQPIIPPSIVGLLNRGRRSAVQVNLNIENIYCEIIRKVFLQSDHNKDGHLSIEEFGITTSKSVDLIEKMDLNKNYFIEPNELNSYCLTEHKKLSEHKREKRLIITYNGQTVYGDGGFIQNENCNDNGGYITNGYYVPTTQTIYI